MRNLQNRVTLAGSVLLIVVSAGSASGSLGQTATAPSVSITCHIGDLGSEVLEIAMPTGKPLSNCGYQIWPHFVDTKGKDLRSFDSKRNEAVQQPTLRPFSCGLFRTEMSDAVRLSSNDVVDLLSEASIRGGALLKDFDVRVQYTAQPNLELSVAARAIACRRIAAR
jgi:hypothetical protein